VPFRLTSVPLLPQRAGGLIGGRASVTLRSDWAIGSYLKSELEAAGGANLVGLGALMLGVFGANPPAATPTAAACRAAFMDFSVRCAAELYAPRLLTAMLRFRFTAQAGTHVRRGTPFVEAVNLLPGPPYTAMAIGKALASLQQDGTIDPTPAQIRERVRSQAAAGGAGHAAAVGGQVGATAMAQNLTSPSRAAESKAGNARSGSSNGLVSLATSHPPMPP